MIETIKYLQCTNHKVCLVSIDFPGLSSRSHQVKKLLEKKKKKTSIQYVAVGTFAVSNKAFIYDSEALLSNTKLLEKFECRPKTLATLVS